GSSRAARPATGRRRAPCWASGSRRSAAAAQQSFRWACRPGRDGSLCRLRRSYSYGPPVEYADGVRTALADLHSIQDHRTSLSSHPSTTLVDVKMTGNQDSGEPDTCRLDLASRQALRRQRRGELVSEKITRNRRAERRHTSNPEAS